MITVVKAPIEEVFQWVKAKKIRDSKTLAALLLAQPYLLR
jgi:hypothetical protein